MGLERSDSESLGRTKAFEAGGARIRAGAKGDAVKKAALLKRVAASKKARTTAVPDRITDKIGDSRTFGSEKLLKFFNNINSDIFRETAREKYNKEHPKVPQSKPWHQGPNQDQSGANTSTSSSKNPFDFLLERLLGPH